MTADNFLIFGIVLIVASVALGLIAYAFVLSRREAEKSEAEEEAPQAVPEAPIAQPPQPTQAEPQQRDKPSWLKMLSRPAAPAEAPAPAAAAPAPSPAARTPATPVGVIMRDDASGRYFLRMGERELRRPEDVRDPADRRVVDGLLGELNRLVEWPLPRATKLTAARPAAVEGYTETPSRPLSMVEQINVILERKLAELPGSPRAVRLVEGTAGSVRVYVGVDRYDTIDDVPDTEVRRMIREAVAEWEARV